MKTFRGASLAILFYAMPALLGIFAARADDDLSGDSDDHLQVAYALYGGIDNHLSVYTNVTDRVVALLRNSTPFAVNAKVILGQDINKDYQSLLIIYNYDGHAYLFNMAQGGGTVDAQTLRNTARRSS